MTCEHHLQMEHESSHAAVVLKLMLTLFDHQGFSVFKYRRSSQLVSVDNQKGKKDYRKHQKETKHTTN